METGKTILSISCGTLARLTLTCSSSPSPSPVRLSPRCSTEPSGLLRLLKKTKCWSDRTLPSFLRAMALASRSKSVPVVLRASQPRPTVTAVRPGASLLSETFPPLLRLTPTVLSLRHGHWARSEGGPRLVLVPVVVVRVVLVPVFLVSVFVFVVRVVLVCSRAVRLCRRSTRHQARPARSA